MKVSHVMIGLSCFALGILAAIVWGQTRRAQTHQAGKLDAAFVGHGSRPVDAKRKARLQRDTAINSLRPLNEKEKTGLISQAGRVIVGVTTQAVLTPQQPLIPGKASLQAVLADYWWNPAPGYESTPGYIRLNGVYTDMVVQFKVPTTRTVLISYHIKAKKGDRFMMTVSSFDLTWEFYKLVVSEEGEQTISCTYTPSESGIYIVQLYPDDDFMWNFYSAEISVEK